MWVVSSKKNRLSQSNGGYFAWLRCYQTAPNDMHINGHPHDHFKIFILSCPFSNQMIYKSGGWL
jgi:hypothetical protein